jgi:hypothetical protein
MYNATKQTAVNAIMSSVCRTQKAVNTLNWQNILSAFVSLCFLYFYLSAFFKLKSSRVWYRLVWYKLNNDVD